MVTSAAHAQSAAPGPSPYGPLAAEPDANGLLLPEGFTSRIVATSGETVGDTNYVWPVFPDGSATFATDDGGWIHTVNSEVFTWLAPEAGGVSAVRYDKEGVIVDAYSILKDSTSNCAGGPTPWGTWLSCEESDQGRVWECDPTGEKEAVAHLAMGRWPHEAVTFHEPSKTLYLTEDKPDGLLYRFTPTAYPKLDAGQLEAAVVASDGSVTWQQVPDPSATDTPTREQVPAATTFNGGEGIWSYEDEVYFCTKGDDTVHVLDVKSQTHGLIWKGEPGRLGVEGAVLSGVDNITVDAGNGDLYVAEDGGNMEVVLITADGVVAPFVRIVGAGHDGSEVTGPSFNPNRDRLYFSSQRGPSTKTLGDALPGVNGGTGIGVTFEVTGPFRGRIKPVDTPPAPTTTLANAANEGSGAGASEKDPEGDSGSNPGLLIGGVAVAAAAVAGGVVALRRRGRTEPDEAGDEDQRS